MTLKSKSPRESSVETRHLVMPQDANPGGTLFGAQAVAWIDMIAAMAAVKYCGQVAVTASIDTLVFKAPSKIGDQVVLKAQVNYVGTTSMEIGVQMTTENPIAGTSFHSTTAYLTFVSIDDKGKPIPVPPLRPETDEEKRRYENGKIRVASRKELLLKIKRKESSE